MGSQKKILLDDVQHEALELLAASRSTTVPELVRQAVSRLLDEERDRVSRKTVSSSNVDVDAALMAANVALI